MSFHLYLFAIFFSILLFFFAIFFRSDSTDCWNVYTTNARLGGHIVSFQYLSRSSLHRLAGLPCRLVLSLWSPSGDTRGPSVVFEAVDMPCPGPFHCSYSVDYIHDFCPLLDPDVGLSICVCDVEHTSFHFGLCGRKFVLGLFGQCPAPYVVAGST